MLCCQVRLKALEMPPADQAFDRVAAKIALDAAARLKRRRRFFSRECQGDILASNTPIASTYTAIMVPRCSHREVVEMQLLCFDLSSSARTAEVMCSDVYDLNVIAGLARRG